MDWSHSAHRLVRRDHSRYRYDDRPPRQSAYLPAYLPARRSAHGRHLSVRPHLAAGSATVVISGELDLLSTPSLAEHLERILAQQPQRLVFDLTRVTFMDCAAARLIAGTDRSLPDGQRPVLRNPSAEVRRILELTGLEARCELAGEGDARLGRRRCERSS